MIKLAELEEARIYNKAVSSVQNEPKPKEQKLCPFNKLPCVIQCLAFVPNPDNPKRGKCIIMEYYWKAFQHGQ